jgi:hypothetical protein
MMVEQRLTAQCARRDLYERFEQTVINCAFGVADVHAALQLSEQSWPGSPILASILLSVFGSIDAGVFRFDYLMPAQLFPAAAAGSAAVSSAERSA